MAEGLSNEELKEIRRTFNMLDVNHDERLSSSEIIKGIHLLKVHPTEEETQDIIEALDLDGDGLVTWDEYLNAMAGQIKKQSYEKKLFLDAFKKFDKDGSGYIEKSELKTMLKKKGANWTDDDIAYLNELFEEADTNNDGKLEYKEFVKAFCEQ